MPKHNQTILFDRRLQFMQGNGDVSARVQVSEYPQMRERIRRYASLGVNINHFGSYGKTHIGLSHATVSILIEMLEGVRDALEGQKEHLFDRCQLFDLMGGKQQVIEHPLAPGRRNSTEEMDDEPETVKE